ncbi:hypothetical protein CR513_16499, partial [Mucuna pruriens]
MKGLSMNPKRIHGVSLKLQVEQNLDCIKCEDLTKFKLIALSFNGHALIWWNEIALQIRGMRRASIDSWEELKREVRKRFVPLYYRRDFYKKCIKVQDVYEYFKEMEVTIIRA